MSEEEQNDQDEAQDLKGIIMSRAYQAHCDGDELVPIAEIEDLAGIKRDDQDKSSLSTSLGKMCRVLFELQESRLLQFRSMKMKDGSRGSYWWFKTDSLPPGASITDAGMRWVDDRREKEEDSPPVIGF